MSTMFVKIFKGGGNYYYIHSACDETYVLKAITSTNGGNICIVPYTKMTLICCLNFQKIQMEVI